MRPLGGQRPPPHVRDVAGQSDTDVHGEVSSTVTAANMSSYWPSWAARREGARQFDAFQADSDAIEMMIAQAELIRSRQLRRLRRIVFAVIDDLDAQILHALQLAPRVSFRRIAAVVESTEATVARRYHRLRRDGVVRVVGIQNRWVDGEASWLCRMRAAPPEHIPKIADALIRRPDVSHANVLAGWTDLVCVIRAPPLIEGREDLLQLLPRTTSVTDITIDLLLHTFGDPPPERRGRATGMHSTPSRLKRSWPNGQSRNHGTDRARSAQRTRPSWRRWPKTGARHSRKLAALSGWSVARVGRRLAALEACGALYYDVDVLPERLGHHLSAMLWLTVAPKDVHRVGEGIAAHDQIAFAGATSGSRNVVAIAICRDAGDLYRYLSEQLGKIEEVLGYEVNIRTQRLKQHGSVVSRGRLVNPRPTRIAR